MHIDSKSILLLLSVIIGAQLLAGCSCPKIIHNPTQSSNIDRLIQELNSNDSNISNGAARELSKHPNDQRAVQALVEHINDNANVFELLSGMGPSITPFVMPYLDDEEYQNPLIGALASMELEPKEATVKVVEVYLTASDYEVLNACLLYILVWGDGGIDLTDKIANDMVSSEDATRHNALMAVARFGYRSDAIFDALRNDIQTYRQIADVHTIMRALAYLSPMPEDILETINSQIAEYDELSRIWASCTIYRSSSGKTEELEYIINALDGFRYIAAVEALGLIGPAANSAIPKLQEMLLRSDISPADKDHIRETLQNIQ